MAITSHERNHWEPVFDSVLRHHVRVCLRELSHQSSKCKTELQQDQREYDVLIVVGVCCTQHIRAILAPRSNS